MVKKNKMEMSRFFQTNILPNFLILKVYEAESSIRIFYTYFYGKKKKGFEAAYIYIKKQNG